MFERRNYLSGSNPVAVAGSCIVRQCQARAWRVHLQHVDLGKVKHDA